jgi:hypothetical protein
MYSTNFTQFSCHYPSSTGSSSDSQVETDPTYMLPQPTSSVVNMPLATYAREHMCWLQPFEYFPITFFPPEYISTSVNMNHAGDSNQWDCVGILLKTLCVDQKQYSRTTYRTAANTHNTLAYSVYTCKDDSTNGKHSTQIHDKPLSGHS